MLSNKELVALCQQVGRAYFSYYFERAGNDVGLPL